jgi:hypothetical protein
MNKPIQIKRNKPASSHYRVLYAKTGRKRKLHAATTATADQHAGMGADVPSIGVGRALFVILILHVLAVAAIYIHSAFFADSNELTANEGQRALSEPAAALVVPAAPVAKEVVVKTKAPAKRAVQQVSCLIFLQSSPPVPSILKRQRHLKSLHRKLLQRKPPPPKPLWLKRRNRQ